MIKRMKRVFAIVVIIVIALVISYLIYTGGQMSA